MAAFAKRKLYHLMFLNRYFTDVFILPGAHKEDMGDVRILIIPPFSLRSIILVLLQSSSALVKLSHWLAKYLTSPIQQ